MAIRFPLRLMWSPCGSGLSGRLGEEGPHERLELLPLALRTLVLAPLPLADGEGHGDVLLALLAVELVERHGSSSSLRGSRSRRTAPRVVRPLPGALQYTRERSPRRAGRRATRPALDFSQPRVAPRASARWAAAARRRAAAGRPAVRRAGGRSRPA